MIIYAWNKHVVTSARRRMVPHLGKCSTVQTADILFFCFCFCIPTMHLAKEWLSCRFTWDGPWSYIKYSGSGGERHTVAESKSIYSSTTLNCNFELVALYLRVSILCCFILLEVRSDKLTKHGLQFYCSGSVWPQQAAVFIEKLK